MKRARAGVIALSGLALAWLGLGAWFVVGGSSRTAAHTVAAPASAQERSEIAAKARASRAPDAKGETERPSPQADALARRLVELMKGAPADEDEAGRVESELLALGEGAAAPLLAGLERERDGHLRARLFDVLRKVPGDAAEAGLIAEAVSGDASASRSIAIEALAERRTDPAIRTLDEVARHDPRLPSEPLIVAALDPSDTTTELPDEVVFTPRMQAMAALASTGDARAISLLVAVLREEPDQSLRMEAARDLGQLRSDASTVEALVTAALTDRSPYVRLAALHSLVGVPDPGLLEPLARIATGDSHAGVRLLADQVLARLRQELARLGG